MMTIQKRRNCDSFGIAFEKREIWRSCQELAFTRHFRAKISQKNKLMSRYGRRRSS